MNNCNIISLRGWLIYGKSSQTCNFNSVRSCVVLYRTLPTVARSSRTCRRRRRIRRTARRGSSADQREWSQSQNCGRIICVATTAAATQQWDGSILRCSSRLSPISLSQDPFRQRSLWIEIRHSLKLLTRLCCGVANNKRTISSVVVRIYRRRSIWFYQTSYCFFFV